MYPYTHLSFVVFKGNFFIFPPQVPAGAPGAKLRGRESPEQVPADGGDGPGGLRQGLAVCGEGGTGGL